MGESIESTKALGTPLRISADRNLQEIPELPQRHAERGPKALFAAALDAKPVLDAIRVPQAAPGEGDFTMAQLMHETEKNIPMAYITTAIQNLPSSAVYEGVGADKKRRIFITAESFELMRNGMQEERYKNPFRLRAPELRVNLNAATTALQYAIREKMSMQVEVSAELGMTDEEHAKATDEICCYTVGQWLAALTKVPAPLPEGYTTAQALAAEIATSKIDPKQFAGRGLRRHQVPDIEIIDFAEPDTKRTFEGLLGLTVGITATEQLPSEPDSEQGNQYFSIGKKGGREKRQSSDPLAGENTIIEGGPQVEPDEGHLKRGVAKLDAAHNEAPNLDAGLDAIKQNEIQGE